MAIVKMDKFNLLAFKNDRDDLLNTLQNFNYVHFNDLVLEDEEGYIKEVRETKMLAEIDDSLNKVSYTINTIEDFTKNLPEELNTKLEDLSIAEINKRGSNFGFDLIYQKLRDLMSKREKDINQRQVLEQRGIDLTPWKDIDINIDDLYDSDKFFIETGTISKTLYEALQKALVDRNLDGTLVYRLGERDNDDYVVALSSLEDKEKFQETLREYGFSKIRIKADDNVGTTLSTISTDKDSLNQDIKKIEEEIIDLRKYLKDLYIYQSYIINKRKKEESSEYFLTTEQMNIIEGYVPSDRIEDFKKDLGGLLGERYILDVIPAPMDDPNVPIILKNNKLIEPYETIVETYALPKYNEIDPTALIAPFYTIFTGFMIGDLGYGLVVAIAILLLLKFKEFPKPTQKNMKLFLRISLSACFFGLIFGSVFGINISDIINVPKINGIPIVGMINPSTDINTLIVMSLVIGAISLFFALGIKGFMKIRDGKALDAFFDVFTRYMAVGGAIALALTGSDIAKYIMIAGMLIILLFAGRASKSFLARFASGAYELYGISSWIGDFVSFLRLMALVLSGGFVAYSVNIIVKMLIDAGFPAVIGAVLIFVVFQLFNMFLSYLSAYVHSMRLIYVEMFNKFYEGGGIRFREMVEDTNFINIIRGGKK